VLSIRANRPKRLSRLVCIDQFWHILPSPSSLQSTPSPSSQRIPLPAVVSVVGSLCLSRCGGCDRDQPDNTPPKRMSVGVKNPRLPCTMLDAEKPVPTVTATNSNPIRVAAAVPTIIKKLSQPWSIVKQCSPSAAFVYYELRGRTSYQ
jgi:hypothetical protein